MIDDNTQYIHERRGLPRHRVKIDVNYRCGETYLFAHTENLSELGIFLVLKEPFATGTRIELRFAPPEGGEPIEVTGEVMWVKSGDPSQKPGMGVRFVDPSPQVHERIKSLIRTIAYLE